MVFFIAAKLFDGLAAVFIVALMLGALAIASVHFCLLQFHD
jgi:hypothetical protein